MLRTASLSIVVALTFSTAAYAQGKHCAGEPSARWVGDQILGFQTNPVGLETVVRVGPCVPLITTPGPLFDYTNFTVGFVNVLSPAYDQPGVFAQLTPLSVLILRAEVMAVGMWNLPFGRAAYFGLDSYNADAREEVLTTDVGASALGWNAIFTAVLRASVPVGPVNLIVLNALSSEYWSLGDASHFLVLRYDLIAARHDWLVIDESMLLTEVPFSDSLALRVGAFDSMRYVPNSDYVRNQVGGIVTLNIKHPMDGVAELQPLLRLGVYTNHVFRENELSLVAGVTANYDFGAL